MARVWKDKVVERPRTFTSQNNADGTITLVPAPGQIIEAGTPVNAANLNGIEADLKEMARKDGSLQENLNAQKINGKTAAQIPQTVEKQDIIGMINEVLNKGLKIKNETTGTWYFLKLDNDGLYLQEV